MTLNFTILGCGSSGGVPRPALGWGVCDPNNPKNRRRRTSLLVERAAEHGGVTRVLVDTSPDLREQLLDADVDWLDGVLYTHEHADHTHGIDDLRALFHQAARSDRRLSRRADRRRSSAPASAIASRRRPAANIRRSCASTGSWPAQPVTIAGQGGPIEALPVLQEHGDIASLGFRFGNVAYSCDLNGLPPESAAALAASTSGSSMPCATGRIPAISRSTDALGWIERLKPRRAILTNLHADLDYETLRKELRRPASWYEPADTSMGLPGGCSIICSYANHAIVLGNPIVPHFRVQHVKAPALADDGGSGGSALSRPSNL